MMKKFIMVCRNFNNNDNNNINSCIYNAHISIQRWCSRRSILLLPPVVGYNFKTALIVHNFHSQGSIPCRAAYRGVTGKYILHNIILHILHGTHLYTWVESSNVDKVSCWRTKVPGTDGNRTRNPLIQSQGFTPIYHSISTLLPKINRPSIEPIKKNGTIVFPANQKQAGPKIPWKLAVITKLPRIVNCMYYEHDWLYLHFHG